MEENQNNSQDSTMENNQSSNEPISNQAANPQTSNVENTFKKDTQAVKGFFTAFFKNPLGTLKNVALDSKNSFFKIAIIVLVIWLITILLLGVVGMAKTYLFGTFGSFDRFFSNLFPNMFDIVKDLLAPIITIVVLAGLVYGFKKQKNRSFLSIASAIVIAKIPVVIASIVSLLTLISSSISKLTSPFASFCNVLSTILLFFVIRDISNENENKTYFWKFALIMGIYYVIDFVLTFLGIYL